MPDRLGRLAPLLIGLPLVAVVWYWHFSSSIVAAERLHRDTTHALRMLSRLPSASAKPDIVRASELAIAIRQVLPTLALVDPQSAMLYAPVDQLERAAGSGRVDRLALENALIGVDDARGRILRSVEQVLRSNRSLEHQLYGAWASILLAVVALSLGITRPKAGLPAGLGALLFENSRGPVTVAAEDGRLVAVNEAYERLTGFESNEIIGLDEAFNSAQQDPELDEAGERALGLEGTWTGERWLRKKSGEAIGLKVTRFVLGEGRDRHVVTVSADAMSDNHAEQMMIWQAHHDMLTKLPNANLFHERLARTLLEVKTSDVFGAVLAIDLDRFKKVNDSVGHQCGDLLLTQAAYRVAICVRESDTVARLGGDQFAVIMPWIADVTEAERLARSLLERLSKPYFVEDHEVVIGASVGVAIFPQDGDEVGSLLQCADSAKSMAKQNGGGTVVFYEPTMNAGAERRMEIETHLRKAVARQQFVLYYQPIVDQRSGRVVAAEALLRWRHPDWGLVSPADFIPVAEESGLIVEIGQWVVRDVQKQLEAWASVGLVDLRVSINLSARQLKDERDLNHLLEILDHPAARRMSFEITESLLMENQHTVSEFLTSAQAMGMRVALDDFGTGYSSLSYLREFRYDQLKIDKAFIDDLDRPDADFGLVASIVSMGQILGMQVVAEGVETKVQLHHLRKVGCNLIQGFYFSPPVPEDEFLRLWREGFATL